jgi:hypothetical protein
MFSQRGMCRKAAFWLKCLRQLGHCWLAYIVLLVYISWCSGPCPWFVWGRDGIEPSVAIYDWLADEGVLGLKDFKGDYCLCPVKFYVVARTCCLGWLYRCGTVNLSYFSYRDETLSCMFGPKLKMSRCYTFVWFSSSWSPWWNEMFLLVGCNVCFRRIPFMLAGDRT